MKKILCLILCLLFKDSLFGQTVSLFHSGTLYDGFENPVQQTFIKDFSRKYAINLFPHLHSNFNFNGDAQTAFKSIIFTKSYTNSNFGSGNYLNDNNINLNTSLYLFTYKIFKTTNYNRELGISLKLNNEGTADIKNGLCIKHNGKLFQVIDFQHVKPGKGPAFVRTKLKSLTNGKVLDNTFSAGHKIEEVRVETHTFQYLYAEGDDFHFMNTESFEQITLNKKVLDNPGLLKEGTNVMVQINSETEAPLSVDMPASIVLEVTYAEPGVKGNTATNATKSATVETGASVNVPLFINEGDKIKIDTASGSYMERVKE